MSIIDILVILGCLAGGYWIVSSVMGPGVDITRRDPKREAVDAPPASKSAAATKLPNPRQADWHLLLDVPRTAGRAEIEAAYKRQLNKALASADMHQQEQLRLARDAGLAAPRSILP
jgi:hypothetical protein